MTTNYIGKPASRVDGRAKVTGEAKYAAEFNVPDLLYGYVVSSTIAKGKIKGIDTEAALDVDGVVQVFTHENRPRLAFFDRSYTDEDAPPGSPFRPLYNNKIQFSQQPIALVVASSFEAARHAASLVEVEYDVQESETDLAANEGDAFDPRRGKSTWQPPSGRGNAEKAFANAEKRVETEYTHTAEHHNPMEAMATTAVWESDDSLVVYDKTQGVQNCLQYVCSVFGLSEKQVQIRSPFMGGGFGIGLRPQYQLFLAVLAARELKRSVRVTLTRQQMFSFGHRPATIQRLKLGAAPDGTLESIQHEAVQETSRYETYTETVLDWSGTLYQCENVALEHKLVELDLSTPLDMRAPGGVTGVYALEGAMDELAYEVGIDPLELRLKNYAEQDQAKGLPFSSKALRECYLEGAERFGWAKRNPAPRSTRNGHKLVGWGVATGVWEAMRVQASAKAVLSPDGKLVVSSSTSDIGTGTYTVMSQIAAESLGLPIDQVTFLLGDSTLPQAPMQGGSWTVASVGSAVKEACDAVGEQVFKLARKLKDSPFAKSKIEDVTFADGFLALASDPSKRFAIGDVLTQSGTSVIEQEVTSKPGSEQKKYSMYSHSAVFAEVQVDEELGTVEVTRVVSAIAGGRVLNPKTARSQILGAVVWGISMALHEESVLDNTFGRFMNHNLAEYHVPVNADIHDIDVIFVDEHEDKLNALGAKGLGEIGIVGVAAAISNAVFHATGKRVRDLPITLDKLL